ncbi:Imm26 family immunity protein [Rhizobium sp. LjRoot254]|uniref:Imm26 family immunity protein n=1 Tax=Rhizobium sp. LjRoot254 TaxID=3342297 RepID=UPI003ED0F6F1
MARVPYKEGDLFAVPLRSEGYGIGIVARAAKYGGTFIFGYFFDRAFPVVPSLAEVESLSVADAIYVTKFANHGLKSGEWPILGAAALFERAKWPMPQFFRKEILYGKAAWLVTYDEDRPGRFINEFRCDPSLAGQFPDDFIDFYGAVEIKLSMMLADGRGSRAISTF